VAGQQGADPLAPAHDVAARDGGLDRLEARHEPAGVLDRDDRTSGDRAREAHGAVVGSDDRRARRRLEVDAAMPGSVWSRRHVEGSRDRRGLDGPGPRRDGEREQDPEGAHPDRLPRSAIEPGGCARHRWRTGLRQRASRRVAWEGVASRR
jgi:hypothetical protein